MQFAMMVKLEEIATIRAGHPFRGAIQEVDNGNGYVIQTRDLADDGQIAWEKLVQTNVSGRKEPEWLKAGDVIFAARGIKNLASAISGEMLDQLELPAVCSPHYFQIRLAQNVKLLPEFLAWQLNQLPAQRHFQQSAEGSAQVSIRRTVLEQTPVMIPSPETQRRVLALSQSATREEQIYQQLIELRRAEMQAIANQVLTGKIK
ncbi:MULTISPECIES: restriction endonuclease subunit S [Providencia]|nr:MULTISPECIES: restriction endonuclease subunit S [Providencia]